jgi:Protein of unknown function (Hypoth_ymh)
MTTSTAKRTIPPFSSQQLEGISKTLGHTADGLKGSEIGHLLWDCGMPDPTPADTKWQRVYNAFADDQNRYQIGTHIMQFIVKAMNPARYTTDPVSFRIRRDRLNTVLAFAGYQITESGKVRAVESARTIREALERANRLHSALVQRAVYHDVLKSRQAESVQENYSHGVFEAMKSITAKIRRIARLSNDGVDLVHDAFGQNCGPPILTINLRQTRIRREEQRVRSAVFHSPERRSTDLSRSMTCAKDENRRWDKSVWHDQKAFVAFRKYATRRESLRVCGSRDLWHDREIGTARALRRTQY